MRWPRCVAQALALKELEQTFDRARLSVDLRVPIAELAKARGHRSEREIRRIATLDLVPGERRRDACVRRGSYRVCGSDGAILGVLVVVDEHTVTLLLPPLAGGELRCASLDLTRERKRRTTHLVEIPAPLDTHADVHAARAGR